jgi:hypothetical protein
MPQNVGNDYVDKFGRIWKFREIVGENLQLMHSKYNLTWCNANKGTMNYRCEKCQFRGIFVNLNGRLYTRGKHEHKREK